MKEKKGTAKPSKIPIDRRKKQTEKKEILGNIEKFQKQNRDAIKKDVKEELKIMVERIKELEGEFYQKFPNAQRIPEWWFPFVYLSCKFKFSPYDRNITQGLTMHNMTIYEIIGMRSNTVITYLCAHKDYREWLSEKKLEALDLQKWNMDYMVSQAVIAMEELLLFGPAPVRRDVAFKILEKYKFLDSEKSDINNNIHLPPTIQIITHNETDLNKIEKKDIDGQ